MQLQYLLFDFSADGSGSGSFDAMASVLPDRRVALLAEVASVLRWSWNAFGPPGSGEGEGDWHFDLHAGTETGLPLHVAYEPGGGAVRLGDPRGGSARITLTFALAGSRAFCEAFSQAFEVGE